MQTVTWDNGHYSTPHTATQGSFWDTPGNFVDIASPPIRGGKNTFAITGMPDPSTGEFHTDLEAHASATAMVMRMREAIRSGVPTSLAGRADSFSAEDIHQAALAGDAGARQNIELTGRYLGLGVSNIMHIINPQVIAFSGGVTAAGEMLMAPLLDEVEKRTLEASRARVKVCFAELPHDAGIIGAARCFMLQ
jgi:predicted NBD/HSP70 family sugar kinase